LTLYGRAMKYGYSNTRAKAMESKLIDTATMRSIADAKDIDSVLAILFQTDYNAAITKFGGLAISPIMFDFAVSENMAERINKIAQITPKSDQHMIRRIIARWDLSNVKRVLEAIERKQSYDAISRYIISSTEFTPIILQDAMRTGSIEGALTMLARNPNYKNILDAALVAYKRSGNLLEAMAALDIEHYRELGDLVLELAKKHDAAAAIMRMDIDMRNILTLIRAKRKNLKYADTSPNLIKNGDIELKALAKQYSSSDDVLAFANKIKGFDLKNAAEVYSENGQLLSFEVSMRNQIFNTSLKLLRTSVLSFGSLVDYVYLKEVEVFTLRALIKSKEYGLTKEEISRLVVWDL
jgi:vacuolar-type H+-ATPase subunit C/Vma6